MLAHSPLTNFKQYLSTENQGKMVLTEHSIYLVSALFSSAETKSCADLLQSQPIESNKIKFNEKYSIPNQCYQHVNFSVLQGHTKFTFFQSRGFQKVLAGQMPLTSVI